MHLIFTTLIITLVLTTTAKGQEGDVSPKLVICGGGSMPDSVFQRFLKMAGPKPNLVVIPTASSRDLDPEKVQKLWRSRGFQDVFVLHTNNRNVASTSEFIEPLKTATAIWFCGGSQQRIADAYLNTLLEKEVYELIQRGGVVGGTSAGAAIQSRVMIASGSREPKISTGLDLLPGSIIDQHFLKRNRIPRLLVAIRAHPHLIGFGIDEGTALITQEGNAQVIGKSFVLRMESVEGMIQLDAYNNGEEVPLANR
ncbi:cyanophycinase [Rubinisphaera italica]|uniref:Cyanophycinase n=1 Tax=Rubinisphaera italica TaxID=2527969 RepID=A0A5C5XNB4_9PLAN|nr:cyanophycinase [Rubinisphaera italica]TWT63971.1 Cyanophycinase [Rubinisphaera italica]